MSSVARSACVVALAGGLLLAIAGCGGGSATTSGPRATGPVASAGAGGLTVEAREYEFTPSTISVPAGEVTFSVRNAGTEEHEFEIFKGETVVDEIEGLVPGLTKELTVTLAAGEYQFMCKLNGHDQLGMKGTLTVTGA
jgi:iron uptake system component EfeO